MQKSKELVPQKYNVQKSSILIELYSGSVIEVPYTGFALDTGLGVMVKTASDIIEEKLRGYETANLINIGNSQLINISKEVKIISKGKSLEHWEPVQ